MFQTKVAEKIKIHILFAITFSRKSCRFLDNEEKYGTAGQATDDNTAHAYKGAIRIGATNTTMRTHS
jgi:hypothetical protein